MRKKSVLLGFAASGAIVLGASAATLPANAAPLPSPMVSPSSASAGSLSPAVGSILCEGNLCIQRITDIVNGKANVKAWAWKTTFAGDFSLGGGPAGIFVQSPNQTWTAGGTGYVFTNVPQGGGYTATEWTNGSFGGSETGIITFAV